MAGSSTQRRIARAGYYAPPSVQLVNWPLRDDGVRAWLMVTMFLAVAVVAASISRSPSMGLVVFAALALAAWRLWIPVRFEFSSNGVVQTVLGRRRRIPWAEFDRYEIRRHGVLLLADAETTPLGALRGLFVRWQNQRDELLELLNFFINARINSQASTTRTYPE
jgi:hypothetical protein